MFSIKQKRDIAVKVQKILRDTNHPELPLHKEIEFNLHIEGAEEWAWANIRNNKSVDNPSINLWNEKVALDMKKEEKRE